MYSNQSFDERVSGSVCSEGYDYQNEVTGNRFFMKWSPQEDMKFYSRSRYGSPRMLSQSVPRKNKNLARYRISRSLNFDSGVSKTDLKFKSFNSSSDSICCDDEKQLSRSAKIMKALNLSSPLSIGKRKVNKSLNFNMSSSPKELINFNESPCNIVHLNLSTSSPKICKSLNFDSSPAESNISSILGTSIDSIDENQNQTPSQRRSNVKKSLKYLTPKRKTSNCSLDLNGKSPMLRSELKKKIDNIVQVTTPNIQSLKKSNRKLPFADDIFVRTPRNLFNDFDDEDHRGSQTPKNKFILVPESMSAIKMSHKKERVSRRLEAEVMTNEILEDEQLIEKLKNLKEQRSSTPPAQEDLQSPKFDITSIKRSHKKDKSKRKLPLNRSEDELSETGSIFDYSGIQNLSNSCGAGSDHFEPERSDRAESGSNALKILENKVILSPMKLTFVSDSDHEKLKDCAEAAPKFVSDLDHEKLKDCAEAAPESKKVDIVINVTSPTDSPNDEGSQTSSRPSTPKNRINFLQHVMGSSIKKSHKKIKDENKKKILKPRILQSGLGDTISNQDGEHLVINEEPQASCSNVDRAATPDNINSSRLLLPKFSSVKKSHKKDKQSKILSSFARRQKIFSYNKERLSSSECGFKNRSFVQEDFRSCSLQPINNIEESCKTSEEISDVNNQSSPHFNHISESSPNKRKISCCSDLDCTPLSMHDSVSIDYVTAEEEFKIFTPIKKRRAAPNRRLSGHEFEDIPLTRCKTPVLDQSRAEDSTQDNFVTPERSINALTAPGEPKGKSTPTNKTTPKNRSIKELMSNVNSIKRSHRKDKKGTRLSYKNESTRLDFELESHIREIDFPLISTSNLLTPESSFLSNNASETSFKNISHMASKFLQSYKYDTSKPSTSYESKDDDLEEKNTCTQMNSTPPNLLKTKRYLEIIQNDSIKRSHKKKREELRHSMLVQDPELSNDGSIFEEEDKMEDFPVDCAIDGNSAGNNLSIKDRVSVVINMNESLLEENVNEKKRRSLRQNPCRRIANSSNDGSLFGSTEELKERCNDFFEME